MRIIYLLLFILYTTVIKAQNISVIDFRLDEMDLTANQQGTTVLDQNGEKCALIKVKTTQTGFSFDAGSLGVSKTLQKTAEIWVYVPHGVRKLNVSHQKYGSLDYALPMTTQKAKTYIMELKAETPLPVNSQRLMIKCMQRNAVVSIDGDMIDLSNGVGEVTLKLGSHKYVAMANGYYQTEGAIELKADRPGKLTIELEPKEKVELAQEDNSANTDTSRGNKTQETINNDDNSPAGLLRQFVSEALSWYDITDINVDVKEFSRKYGGKLQKDAGKLDYIGLKDKTDVYYNNSGEITRIQLYIPTLSKTKPFPSELKGLTWDSNVDDWAQWLDSNKLRSSLQQNELVCISSMIQVNENMYVVVARMKLPGYDHIVFYLSRNNSMF